MTISSTTNRVVYTGNGSTTAFAVSFPFHAQGDLVVISTVIATGVQTTKALTTDYTISGTTDALGHYTNGGTVNAVTAPASTVTWTIYRDPALTQSVDLVENDPLPVEAAVESPLDRLTMIAQRSRELTARALKQPEGDSADIDYLPAKVTRASKYLAFDADGDPVATAGTANAFVVSTFMETVLDDTTAAAARTTLGALGSTLTVPLVFASGLSNPATDIMTGICEGRLTLTSGTPVTTSDVTAAETLYFTPYKGNRVAVVGSTGWMLFQFTELSVDVPDATNCYDVFLYESAGVLALELLAWTNETTRATALTTQNGVLVKTGDATRRYLGTFYSTTAGNGQVEDSYAKRNLWNYYNRVDRPMRVIEATDSWNYTTATWRQANAAAANQLEYVQGVSEDAVLATVQGLVGNGTTCFVASGVGVDSTSVNSATVFGARVSVSATKPEQIRAEYRGFPGVGRHLLVWLEISEAAGTSTWYGDNGGTIIQSGMTGVLPG